MQHPKPPPPRLVEIAANQLRPGDITRDGLIVVTICRAPNGVHADAIHETDDTRSVQPVRWRNLQRLLVRCPRPHAHPYPTRDAETEAAGAHQVELEREAS